MRKNDIINLTIGSLILIQASFAFAEDFAGRYEISRGIHPKDGKAYSGKVVINSMGDNVYKVYWYFPGGSKYSGIGILENGDTLCVGWSTEPGFGVTVYAVEGGKLKGEWVHDQSQAYLGAEELEGPPGLDGTYEIKKAHGADWGPPYTGTVRISPSGGYYNLVWDVDGEKTNGVGLLKGDMFVAGWGVRGGVMYYTKSENGLTGKWALQGAPGVGEEELVKVKK